MSNRLISLIRAYRNDDTGSITTGFVLMFPLLLGGFLSTWAFFDAFRNQAINLKANYTIADSLSRQERYITNDFMVNTWRMHRFLTNSPTLTKLRISVISYDEDNDKHRLNWSRAKGGGGDYDDTTIETIGLLEEQIPFIPDDEFLIVVQTAVDYAPGYSVGLGQFTFENTTYTRHRWAPQMCFDYTGNGISPVC